MDRNKTREILKRAHPKLKIVEPTDEQTYEAAADASDVDVRGLSTGTWKKFGRGPQETPMGSDSPSSDIRDRFRPRKLTGAGPVGSDTGHSSTGGASSRTAGKISLERMVPEDHGSDSNNAIDVLIDDDHGIIGESDSGPEKKK